MQNSNTSFYSEPQLVQQESSFQSNYSFIRPFIIYPKSQIKSFSHSTNASWTNLQIVRHFVFLEINADNLKNLISWATFKSMSEFVQTRNANQCRMYHQKIMKQYNSLDQLLIFHKSIILKNLEFYQNEKDKLLSQLEAKSQIKNSKNHTKEQIQQDAHYIQIDIKSFYQNNRKKINQNVGSNQLEVAEFQEPIKVELEKTGVEYCQKQNPQINKKQQKIRKSFDLESF